MFVRFKKYIKLLKKNKTEVLKVFCYGGYILNRF